MKQTGRMKEQTFFFFKLFLYKSLAKKLRFSYFAHKILVLSLYGQMADLLHEKQESRGLRRQFKVHFHEWVHHWSGLPSRREPQISGAEALLGLAYVRIPL